jgi:hypothetical protein
VRQSESEPVDTGGCATTFHVGAVPIRLRTRVPAETLGQCNRAGLEAAPRNGETGLAAGARPAFTYRTGSEHAMPCTQLANERKPIQKGTS